MINLALFAFRLMFNQPVSVYSQYRMEILATVAVFLGLGGILVALLFEIRRRKKIEAALRVSEDKFKHVFEYSNIGKSLTLASGEINVNKTFCEMLGFSKEELDHKRWQDITHPDDIELTQREFNALLSGNKDTTRFTKRYLKKDGSTIWVDLSTSLRRNTGGQPLYFMTSLVDITQRKQAEEHIIKINRMYLILSTINEAIVRLHELDWLYPEACRIAVELGGFRMAWIGFVDEKTQKVKPAAYAGIVEDYLEKLEVTTRDEARGRGPSGSALRDGHYSISNDIEHDPRMESWRADALRLGYYSSAAFPLRVSGRVCGIFNLYASEPDFFNEDEIKLLQELSQDLSFAMEFAERDKQRAQAEEAVHRLNTELEQRVKERTRELHAAQEQLIQQERLAVLGQLAAGVSHELRNPLGVIQNAVYFLKLVQPEANEKIKEYYRMIEDELTIAEKIITDLFDFSRIQSVNREPTEVAALIHQTLTRFPTPPAVDLALEFPADLPPVYADPDHIAQVFGKLVVNAYQAMPEGGQLSLSGKQLSANNAQWVLICFKDTGTGISPENMPKLFEPLFTTKLKGMGLGLAVSQKLIEANGGRIEVQSQPGQGSTFTVYLPVFRVER